jgi:hypothetical protein
VGLVQSQVSEDVTLPGGILLIERWALTLPLTPKEDNQRCGGFCSLLAGAIARVIWAEGVENTDRNIARRFMPVGAITDRVL